MNYNQTISAAGMRTINRTAIIDLIRRESPISRSYISQTLGISLPTVMRFVDELIAEHLVKQLSETERTGGRRRPLIELNSDENVVIGINLADSNPFGAIADLSGLILREIEIPHTSRDPEKNLSEIIELIDQLLHSAEDAGKNVLGIGIGAPGVTRHKEGVVVWAPTLNWRDFPLRERLAERFSIPIIVDNDVNLEALGEMFYGEGRNLKNLVVLSLGAGTGSAVVVDGFLCRGAHEAAGEIGYQIPDRDSLHGPVSEFGSMEKRVSGVSLLEKARRLATGTGIDPKNLDLKNVLEFLRERQPWIMPVYEEMVDYLAMMVSSLSSILDPEVIIFTGGLAALSDLFIPEIQQLLRGRQPAGVQLNLKKSTLGPRSCVLGAITIVLNHTNEQFVVRTID